MYPGDFFCADGECRKSFDVSLRKCKLRYLPAEFIISLVIKIKSNWKERLMIRSAKLACGGAVALMLLGGMICPAMAETNTDSAYGRVEQR